MPGYQFTVTLTLNNPSTTPLVVTIPRGTIIEPESTHLTYQSAVVARDYTFKLQPNEKRSVLLEAECWNQHLSSPHGVSGKLTNLKGAVKNQADVWNVSSTPKSNTVLTRPSMDGHLFAALADTNPDMAYRFLNSAGQEAKNAGANVHQILQDLATMSTANGVAAQDRRNLINIAQDPLIRPYISAEKLRTFLIRAGQPEANMEALVQLCTGIFAMSTDRLAKSMYEFSSELRALLEEKRTSVKEERRRELSELALGKFTSILDAFPLLDEIQWN